MLCQGICNERLRSDTNMYYIPTAHFGGYITHAREAPFVTMCNDADYLARQKNNIRVFQVASGRRTLSFKKYAG